MRVTFFILIITLFSGCAFAQPASLKFTVRVLDLETGVPVTNAVVQSFFEHQYDPWGNKENIIKRQEISVDGNGDAVFEGKDLQGGIGGTAFAEGYYSGHVGEASERKNLILNRWEPWNPTIEVKMRPKKNPVPMVYKKIFRIKPPVLEQPVGFDLVEADWVAPYGRGIRSDFIFTVTLSDVPKRGAKYTLSFSSATDGIQEYLPSAEYASSSFKWPYEAPLNGYKNNLSRFAYYQFPNPELPGSNLKSPINYIFRVRSQKLDNGEISGSYGFIQGEVQIEKENALYFEYHFNPVPNERSLEWNGINLLKK